MVACAVYYFYFAIVIIIKIYLLTFIYYLYIEGIKINVFKKNIITKKTIFIENALINILTTLHYIYTLLNDDHKKFAHKFLF